ncbi:MAG: flagellar motor switch protein FliN [Tepidisphaeraceae bacterium]
MADETPPNSPPPAADAQMDTLAKELQSMGSIGDATQAADAATPNLAELEALLKEANFELPKSDADPGAQLIADAQGAAQRANSLPPTSHFDLPAFQQAINNANASSIDLLRDVDLNVKIELGRSRMLVEDVLKLAEGSVVELEKLAGDPVDVFVNDRLVARGEVLVLNDNFCVRVNEIVSGVREEA